MAIEDLNWLTSHHVLKVAKMQQFGLLSHAAIFDTERRLARKLHQDTIKNLDNQGLKKLQKERSRKIYAIRAKLQKTTSHRINLKAAVDLEIQSITKMRKHEKQLMKEIKAISKTISDSHNIIIYEQQQVTHDVATVITFLAHFVHILELNLEHNELVKYIPLEYQQRLLMLIESAKNEMINIEVAAEDCILHEFDIHKHIIRRGVKDQFKEKDLGALIESRARSNKRLYGKLTALKSVVKQIHQILEEAKKLSKKDTKGIFIPSIAKLATHASVEFQLLTEHMQEAIKDWPISPDKKRVVIDGSRLLVKQFETIKSKIKAGSKQRKGKVKKEYHIAIELHEKETLRYLNSGIDELDLLRKFLLKPKTTASEQAQEHRQINHFLRESHEGIVKTLSYFSHIQINQNLTEKDQRHKDQLFEKFNHSIKTFETKLDFFYNKLKTRLHNTTDIIKNSLLLQQHLAIELNYLQQYAQNLYATLMKSHLEISKKEKSTVRKNNHSKFAKQMIVKEAELKKELDFLKNTIGIKISHLIREIPDDQALEVTSGKAQVRELEQQGALVAREMHNLSQMIGVVNIK